MPSHVRYQSVASDDEDVWRESEPDTDDPLAGPSTNPWVVVSSQRNGHSLEIRLFSSYSRMMTVTALFGFSTFLAYWTFSLFTAIMARRFHTAMAFVAFSSLLVLLLLGYACCFTAWLEALSLERLTLDATGAVIEHITPIRSFLARITGSTPKCSRRLVLHSRHLQSEVITYPIRSLTGLEEGTALELAPGVRFGNYYLEDEQLDALAAGINAFLQSVGHRPALGGASTTIIERPAPSRVRVDYKDKDRVQFSVTPSMWSIGVLLLFAYEMSMGCVGVLYSFWYTASDHRLDHLIVAVPLLLLSLLFLAITAAFTFLLFSSLATDIIEVDKETVNMRKSHWLPCGGWADSYINTNTALPALDGRPISPERLGTAAYVCYEEGIPVLRVHGHTVAHGAALDDIAWMKAEVDSLLAVYAAGAQA